jgi:hypothetical protein
MWGEISIPITYGNSAMGFLRNTIRDSHITTGILLCNLHGPSPCPKATVEDSTWMTNGGEYKAVIKDNVENSMLKLEALCLILNRSALIHIYCTSNRSRGRL